MLTSSSAQAVTAILLLPFFFAAWRSFSSTLSLSLSVCLLRPYLLASFLPRLCEIDCAPLPSADAAVIEKHTLLRPRALPLSLSPSLPPIGWLIEVTSPFFSACLPPSPSLSCSHSLSPHAQCILPIPLSFFLAPILNFLPPLMSCCSRLFFKISDHVTRTSPAFPPALSPSPGPPFHSSTCVLSC